MNKQAVKLVNNDAQNKKHTLTFLKKAKSTGCVTVPNLYFHSPFGN